MTQWPFADGFRGATPGRRSDGERGGGYAVM
jgi:hypothetical protein